MNKICCWYCLFLAAAGIGAAGTESYSDLMDKAEKLTVKRYDMKSRAFKIKSKELDEILDSDEPQEKKIRRLKDFIAELEEPGQDKKDPTIRQKPEDPLNRLKESARQGDPDALYQLGIIYWEGRLQPRSLTRALHCFRRAASAKHQKAEFMLALADWQGKGVIPDPKKAFTRFDNLSRQGFRPALIPLGILHYEGKGTAKNYSAAEKFLLAGLPEKKHLPVRFVPEAVLGRIYYSGGFGVEPDPGKAAEFLKKADCSDPESQFLLGNLYLNGKGLPVNEAAAVVCFKSAAKTGHLRACLELGRMYHLGRGVKKDDGQAVNFLIRVADHGGPDWDAFMMLAQIYADPKSPVRNDHNAFFYFRQAARKGNTEARYRCGILLKNGIGTEKDLAGALEFAKAAAKMNHAEAAWLCGELEAEAKHWEQSVPFYRQAADLDHVGAIRKFADMALNGKGMKADPELAIQYLKKLGKRANITDLELLASLYESGIGQVKPQIKDAIHYYTLAAGLGSVKSQARLAQLHYALGQTDRALHFAELAAKAKNPDSIRLLAELRKKGSSDPAKQNESIHYLRELADSGDRDAMRQLGILLFGKGDFSGAEKYLKAFENDGGPDILYMLGYMAYRKDDFNLAFPILRRAADAGHVKAMVLLGRMYHRGDGVQQDFRRALLWYRQAASKEDPEGMFQTGMMFYNAEGVSPDYNEALRWFLGAADKGHILAMQYLSIMYKEGIGVPKNNRESVKWRRKAAGSKP